MSHSQQIQLSRSPTSFKSLMVSGYAIAANVQEFSSQRNKLVTSLRTKTDSSTMSEYPIDHLNDEESWDIIQANQIGRIASAREGAPDIYPVTYVVHNWKIYFRTGAESRLRKETDGRLVAFEAGWQMMKHFSSTVALGVLRTMTNSEAARVLDELPIVDFAPDRDYVWMELDPHEVRGRRLNVLDLQS